MSDTDTSKQQYSSHDVIEIDGFQTSIQDRTQDNIQNIGHSEEHNYHTNNINNTNRIVSNVCNPHFKKIIFIMFVGGIVSGWCLTAFVALFRNTKNEIEEICPETQLWNFMVLLIIINSLCFALFVYACYQTMNNVITSHSFRRYLTIILFIQVLAAMGGAMVIFSECAYTHFRTLFIYNVIFSWIIIIVFIVALLLIFCWLFCGTGI